MLNDQNLKSFEEYCAKNKFEINNQQIEIVQLLNKFLNPKKNFLNIFYKP